uniref:Uncharacterized protein n=1 Tax=Setaria italica TaxID=4555 RepID=K4AH89_SETIT
MPERFLPHRNHPYAHSTGGHTHETTTTVVHDFQITMAAGDNLVQITMAAEDNLVIASTVSITSHRTGSPGKSHHREQRGPWSKDGPANII